MQLSIARSLHLALVGLTIVLAVISAGGISLAALSSAATSALVAARQRYEDLLLRSSRLTTAAANLLSAGIAEAEVLRDVSGSGSAARSARRTAAAVYDQAAATAVRLAREDTISRGLVVRQL